MVERVGELVLVDVLVPDDDPGLGTWRAWDAEAEQYVLADLRHARTLRDPQTDLDQRLAGTPGLEVPLRRVERTSPRLVALVGDLSPRRSLAGYPEASGAVAPDLPTVLDGALLALAGLHAQHVSLGEIAAHDLVLRRGVDGRVAVHLSTASATGVAPASARRRDLEQLLRVVGDHQLCPEALAARLTVLVDEVRSGALGSAEEARRRLAPAAGEPAPLPDPPPLPPLPDGWAPEGPTVAGAAESATVVPDARRRLRPLDVVLVLVVLGCVAGLVVALRGGATTATGTSDPAASTGATGAGGTTGSTAPSGSSPTVLASPAASAQAGAPCGFYDVGVLERSGTTTLTCREQPDGTYLWQVR
ncbi:hypothetical protein [Angustibacter luteus]|uniref:Serine/threonine protein kinase n=1 Tax=Angustibacter luteus TaxID=658456 RepID=A0ABW1JGQ2_9ACTN